MGEAKLHSKIGASSAHRWMTCPGSVRMSEGAENKDSPYALEGTAAHTLGEMCLVGNSSPSQFIGSMMEVTGNDGQTHDIEVTEEMADAVTEYVEYVRDTLKNSYGELYVEQKFDLSNIHRGLSGTNDACIIEPFGTLHVFDYKHGRGVKVEVKRNPQLMYYGLGALKDYEVEKVVLHIVQPNCDHPDGRIRAWETTPEDLAKFGRELKDAAALTEEPDAPLVATEKGCKFCPAAGFCPALKERAYSVAKASFAEDDTILLPEPEKLSNEEISKVLASSNLLSSWIASVENHAHSQAEKGNPIPGYKLVKKRANRKWRDESDVVSKFSAVVGDEQLFDKKVKSPAQMEKVVGKSEVDKLTEIPDTGTTLVPEWDKRPEVRPSIEAFNSDI